MTDSFEMGCKETILMNQVALEKNKWFRRYTTIKLNGKEYLCQLSITRKGKNEKQRPLQFKAFRH